MRVSSVVLTGLLLFGMAGCGGQAKAGEVVPDDTPATLRVDNMRPLDMTIYILPSAGIKERLGLARANTVTTFTVPVHLTRRNATLRFVADPIGGRSLPVSHDISIGPGDEVMMRIEP